MIKALQGECPGDSDVDRDGSGTSRSPVERKAGGAAKTAFNADADTDSDDDDDDDDANETLLPAPSSSGAQSSTAAPVASVPAVTTKQKKRSPASSAPAVRGGRNLGVGAGREASNRHRKNRRAGATRSKADAAAGAVADDEGGSVAAGKREGRSVANSGTSTGLEGSGTVDEKQMSPPLPPEGEVQPPAPAPAPPTPASLERPRRRRGARET